MHWNRNDIYLFQIFIEGALSAKNNVYYVIFLIKKS